MRISLRVIVVSVVLIIAYVATISGLACGLMFIRGSSLASRVQGGSVIDVGLLLVSVAALLEIDPSTSSPWTSWAPFPIRQAAISTSLL